MWYVIKWGTLRGPDHYPVIDWLNANTGAPYGRGWYYDEPFLKFRREEDRTLFLLTFGTGNDDGSKHY